MACQCLRICEERWNIRKRALHICKRALHIRKRALDIDVKSPKYSHTGTRHWADCGGMRARVWKEPYIFAKEPYISAKEPRILTWRALHIDAPPWHMVLGRLVVQRGRGLIPIVWKEPYISTKELYISAKEPWILTWRTLYIDASRWHRALSRLVHTFEAVHTAEAVRTFEAVHTFEARHASDSNCVKRALHFRKRALHIRERAVCIRQKNLHIPKRALHICVHTYMFSR